MHINELDSLEIGGWLLLDLVEELSHSWTHARFWTMSSVVHIYLRDKLEVIVDHVDLGFIYAVEQVIIEFRVLVRLQEKEHDMIQALDVNVLKMNVVIMEDSVV
jgi:hypothetical protein